MREYHRLVSEFVGYGFTNTGQPYSLYPEACAVSADRSTRGDHFFAEAKRLLDLEDGRVRLTNAQGLLLLAMRYDNVLTHCLQPTNDGQIFRER